MTGLLWAKLLREKPSWAVIRTGKELLASHLRNFYVWDTVSCSFLILSFSSNFGIVAHEDRLHRASLWAEKSDTQPIMPNSDMSPIVQPQPPAQVPTVPSLPISDMSPQLPVQVPTVPSPAIVQPPAQVPTVVPTVPSPAIVRPPAQVPTVPSPAIVQPPAQVPTVVPTVPSPAIVRPPAQVPTFPIQASFPGFPNFTGTFTSTSHSDFNINPQQSLMDLMSEPLYGWPNQALQGLEDQNLFDFSGLQDFSGANNFDSNRNIHLGDVNVRLVLQGLQVLINIHSYPLLHPRTATISTISTAILPQMSTCCPMSL